MSLFWQNVKTKQHSTERPRCREKLPYLPRGSACAFLKVWYTLKAICSVAILLPKCANNTPRYTVLVTQRAGEGGGYSHFSEMVLLRSARGYPKHCSFITQNTSIYWDIPWHRQCTCTRWNSNQKLMRWAVNVTKLRTKFPAIYWTHRLGAVSTTACNLSLSWDRHIVSIRFHSHSFEWKKKGHSHPNTESRRSPCVTPISILIPG